MVQCFADPLNVSKLNLNDSLMLLYACQSNQDEPVRALHSHNNLLEVMLITDGEGTFTISNKRYCVSAGNIVIINADMVHEEISNPTKPMAQLCLGIANLTLAGLPQNHLLSKGISPVYYPEENFTIYKGLFQSAYNQLYYARANANNVCDSIAETVINLLIQDTGDGKPEQKSSDFIVKRARKYLEENFHNALSLDQVATELNISRYYLSRLFKERSGYSLSEYINRLRIGEAQNLLITTNYPIAQISQTVGIDDPSYFNNIFIKIVGTQPTKYRKKYRMSNDQAI